tara:strand:+ start:754 stop:1161 length:408 start_codon:yes stop_codon:yes gene_type:complete
MPKIKFEKTLLIGSGKITWYMKAERWVKRKIKNPFTQHLLLGMIEYLKKEWIRVKIGNVMLNVDSQSQQLLKQWEENDRTQRKQSMVKRVETGTFGEPDWSIEISNPIVERRTQGSESSLDTGSDALGVEEEQRD